MKFDFRTALDAMGQVATGELAGKMQGMQIAQEHNNQQFHTALNIAQFQDQQQAREMGQRGNVLDIIGRSSAEMTPEGRAAFASKGLEFYQTGKVVDPYQPTPQQHPFPAPMGQGLDAMAGTGMVPGLMQGMGAGLEQELRPEPPPTVKTPLGNFPLAGVNPKEAKSLADRVDKDVSEVGKLYSANPQVMQAVTALIQQKPQGIPKTPEDYRALQQWYTQWLSTKASLQAYAPAEKNYTDRLKGIKDEEERLQHYSDADVAPALIRLWDERGKLETESEGRTIVPGALVGQKKNIEEVRAAMDRGDTEQATRLARVVTGTLQSTMKPEEKRQRISMLLDQLDKQAKSDPQKANDREAQLQLAESLGIRDFIEGIKPGTLDFGGEELEKRWQKANDRVSRGSKLSPGAQQIAFSELKSLARLTGRKIDVTPEMLFSLSPDALLKMQRDKDSFTMKVSEHQMRMAQARVGYTRAQLGIEAAKLGLEKSKLDLKNKKAGGGDKWLRSAQFQTLNNDWGKSQTMYDKYMTDSYLNLRGTFDPDRPGSDPKERKAAALWSRIKSSKAAVDHFLVSHGKDPATLEAEGEAYGTKKDQGELTPNGLAKTQPPANPLSTSPKATSSSPAPIRKRSDIRLDNNARIQLREKYYSAAIRHGVPPEKARQWAEQKTREHQP